MTWSLSWTVMLSLPIFKMPDMAAVGEICLSRSLFSSTISYICSSETEREEPRPTIITVSESVPMSSNWLSI